jgi:hypothetical protein
VANGNRWENPGETAFDSVLSPDAAMGLKRDGSSCGQAFSVFQGRKYPWKFP